MTTMQDQPAGVSEHHADDLLQELTQLRAAHAQLREELSAVRHQRDEAISQAQWLITRVNNAEQAIGRLQAELIELRGKRGPVAVTSPPVAVVDPAPAVAPEPEPARLVAGGWAGRSGPWLPPEDPSYDGSTAHEFAALTERALAVEAERAEQAAADLPPAAGTDVLPPSAGEVTRRTSLFRRH